MNVDTNCSINSDVTQEFKFSFFNKLRNAKKTEDITLSAFVEATRKGKYKGVVDILRDLYISDTEGYKKQKTKLPLITPAGTFTERKRAALEKTSGLIVLDIDGLSFTELAETREVLAKDRHIVCVFVSPSGAGLKAFVRVKIENDAECKSAFSEIQYYFKKRYDIELDKSGKDISRACFVSYDPSIYLNTKNKIDFEYANVEKKKEEKKKDANADRSEALELTAGSRMMAEVEKMPGVSEGARDATAYNIACMCLIDFDRPRSEAMDALRSWNTRNNPPLPELTLERKCDSAEKNYSGIRGSRNKHVEFSTDIIKPKNVEQRKVFELAELPMVVYEQRKEAKSKELGITIAKLDKLVSIDRKRIIAAKKAEPKKQGTIELLAHYFEIKHTLDYWSVETASRVPLNALRKSNPTCFPLYDKHPARKSILPSDIVFKPEGGLMANQVNTFTGLNITPEDRKPEKILELLYGLCNNDDKLYHYVLCWLALPLQKLGTKMDTALVFTSKQGTGKSLFFDKCYGEIYKGWYAKIKQSELEGRFNGWEAQKLFLFADEIEAKHGQNDVANHIKTRITSDTVIIEKKGRDHYTENARANFVFCSNEITPVKIEKGDRRFTSIRTKVKRNKDFYTDVYEETKDNGPGRLYSYLMTYDIGDFTANSTPYETEEKRDQETVFKNSAELFIDLWLDEDPDIKLMRCAVKSLVLYQAYCTYCETSGHSYPISSTKFGLVIKRDYDEVIRKERRGDGNFYIPVSNYEDF